MYWPVLAASRTCSRVLPGRRNVGPGDGAVDLREGRAVSGGSRCLGTRVVVLRRKSHHGVAATPITPASVGPRKSCHRCLAGADGCEHV